MLLSVIERQGARGSCDNSPIMHRKTGSTGLDQTVPHLTSITLHSVGGPEQMRSDLPRQTILGFLAAVSVWRQLQNSAFEGAESLIAVNFARVQQENALCCCHISVEVLALP